MKTAKTHVKGAFIVTKKLCAVLVLAALVAGGLSAQASIGLGGYLGGDFGGGFEASASYLGFSMDMALKTPYFGGGGYLFFDVTYAELFFGFFSGGGPISLSYQVTGLPSEAYELDLTYTNLSFGALGKYPVSIGKSLSVFPLLGIEYLIFTTVKDKSSGEEYSDAVDFSSLWFKLGGGLDFAVTRQLYVRLEALYGLRLANKGEKDIKAEMDPTVDLIESAGGSGESKTRLGHGFTAKLALGFKF
jgi:opacity protein-like surface antigen